MTSVESLYMPSPSTIEYSGDVRSRLGWTSIILTFEIQVKMVFEGHRTIADLQFPSVATEIVGGSVYCFFGCRYVYDGSVQSCV